jgi:hypothetical protein
MSIMVFDERSTFAPDLSRADLEVFARVLGLSDAERLAMLDLYAAYGSTLAAEGREVRAFCAEIIERAEVVQDQRLLAPARERSEKWKKRTEQLKATFLDDLRVLLTRDQESRWPILERELRRLKRVSAGRLPGEDVDLIRTLGDARSSGEPSPALAEVLERYSNDLDRAIVARDKLIEESGDAFSALIKEDAQGAMELFDRARRLRTAVRDVNVRYARLIAAELAPEAAAAFSENVFAASYPELVKPTRGERYIRAVGELQLPGEQAGAMAPVIAAYDAEVRRLREELAMQVWELAHARLPDSLAEAIGQGHEGERRGFSAYGAGEDHPLTALRMKRFELDRSTQSKVDAILTAEQRSSLPDTAVGQVVFTDWGVWGL